MKFEDFDLDLTKITNGYGINPMDADDSSISPSASSPSGPISSQCTLLLCYSWVCGTQTM